MASTVLPGLANLPWSRCRYNNYRLLSTNGAAASALYGMRLQVSVAMNIEHRFGIAKTEVNKAFATASDANVPPTTTEKSEPPKFTLPPIEEEDPDPIVPPPVDYPIPIVLPSHRVDTPVTMIAGASRGLGLEFTRQILAKYPEGPVLATCRNPDGADNLRSLKDQYPSRLTIMKLDVTDEYSIKEAAKDVEQRRKKRSEEEEDSIAAKNAWPHFVIKKRIFARQCVIEKLNRFDGRDISKFCRAYEEAMEGNGIDDSVAIENFHLIVKPELRGPIEELQRQHGVSWRNFKVALKAEYFLEDFQRVTKQTFIKWVQMKNKGLTSRELLREFEKKFDQLSTGEQQSLRSEKVELFVQAADSRLQKSLVQLLEDPAGELGLTNDWDAVPAAINLLVKRQKRIDKSIVVDSHEEFEENGIVEKIVVGEA
ncbi:hypothetical protein L7F22_021975 [Adiantum nelumboides]|nr:hypothetical protein [Adiantum nelumboides]